MELVQIVTLIGIAVANIGTTIGMFMWATNHAAEDRRASEQRTDRLLEAIHQEMKDFHSRLCHVEEKTKRNEK